MGSAAGDTRHPAGACARLLPCVCFITLLLLAGVPVTVAADPGDPFLIVLGIAQDGGAPQAGCMKACCAQRRRDQDQRLHVACLGLVDPGTSQRWIIDATPDFKEQLQMLDGVAPPAAGAVLAGILLTHGHIGHYTGLIHLGREAIGAHGIPVYAMRRMGAFLQGNGPWDQLVGLGNISLRILSADRRVKLSARITITPIPVPHRDEYTETVGFLIEGPSRSVLYVPDINAWERWDRRIEDLIAGVDLAYLDGTFYAADETPNRNIAEIPHPFITASTTRFRSMPAVERAKVRFIHLHHTNPALIKSSAARRAVENAGFRVAAEGERVDL